MEEAAGAGPATEMTMIKNICFDMGGVLYGFSFDTFIDDLGVTDANDHKLLMSSVFRTLEWVRLDRGVLNDDEALEIILPRVPERLKPLAEACVREWGRNEHKHPIPGMDELVHELKENGYNLCLFSNASLTHHEYWPPLPLAPLFGERIMLSADHKIIKPSPDFFTTGAKLLGLNPEECVFIDDVPANVEGAILAGFNGIPFYGDAARLRKEFKALGINVRA